jgi:hypothetical protein
MKEASMSQDNVERILGRLITDRDFFVSCHQSLDKACLERGLLLTDLEMSALGKIDIQQFASFASVLDDRIKRAGTVKEGI